MFFEPFSERAHAEIELGQRNDTDAPFGAVRVTLMHALNVVDFASWSVQFSRSSSRARSRFQLV